MRAGATGTDVCVVNLGCRVNRVESDWIERSFADRGCRVVAQDDADVIVINTCAVTGEAQAKTRKAVRRACACDRARVVAVTGCASSLFPQELTALSPKVRVIPSKLVVAQDALEALDRVRADDRRANRADAPRESRAASAEAPRPGDAPDDPSSDGPAATDAEEANLNADDDGRTESRSGATPEARVKRGVKVQDGCDNRCTYCIVWKARGASRSEPLERIVRQVRQVLDDGAVEIDLTGVNLGRFSAVDGDRALALADLVDVVAGMARGRAVVRASSLEPQDVSDAFLEAMARNADVVCPHLHLPVQSGCTATLERMGRPYTADWFAEKARAARALMPTFSLTTDVIVGFPGETDEEFEESLAFCARVGFSKMHVFRYSPRPGTPACDLPDQVAAPVAAERSRRMRACADELRAADARRRVGGVERVVVERASADGLVRGTTESFHRVRLAASAFATEGGRAPEGLALASLDGYDSATGEMTGRVRRYVRVVQPSLPEAPHPRAR
ncbi:MiaB/RimO family radical SAM methylthiotransferase [bacterium]|nr:MiaB/RimO family radical SAM methylthiotransferase [bacterium]